MNELNCVFFDLCDLLDKLDCKRIKLKEFQEFDNLAEFIEEQKTRINSIETQIRVTYDK